MRVMQIILGIAIGFIIATYMFHIKFRDYVNLKVFKKQPTKAKTAIDEKPKIDIGKKPTDL